MYSHLERRSGEEESIVGVEEFQLADEAAVHILQSMALVDDQAFPLVMPDDLDERRKFHELRNQTNPNRSPSLSSIVPTYFAILNDHFVRGKDDGLSDPRAHRRLLSDFAGFQIASVLGSVMDHDGNEGSEPLEFRIPGRVIAERW